MLELKPVGPGNWAVLRMTLQGKRAASLLVMPGQRLSIGGITYRICKVVLP